jgi:adenylosuccinate lyase
MTTSPAFEHPLAERYASPEMVRLFSPTYRHRIWRQLWLALAEAQRELGLPIPEEALTQMRAQLDATDPERVAELERRLRHDVMAHIHHFGEQAPAARPILHLGATSAYVTDNADLVLHREAMQLVRTRLLHAVAALAEVARRTRDLPTLAYTHFQPAQPTTVGKRVCLWIQDFLLDLEEIDFRLANLRFLGAKGTTGTQASFLELFEGDAAKVEELDRRVARKMGFAAVFPVSGQTYPRKVDAAWLATLAGVAASASKFGTDLRLLAHLHEVEEPFEPEQVGSSAMPYKQNPVRAERIGALARHVIVLSLDPAWTAATQWLERSLDDSANRRLAIPEAYLATDAILVLVHHVAARLRIHPAAIRRHLEEMLPFLITERLLMRAVRAGGDRQTVHERLRVHAVAAWERVKAEGRNDLLERLAADPAIPLDAAALREELDPTRLVGRAPEQVDRFLAEWVDPVLSREPAARQAPVPELRV